MLPTRSDQLPALTMAAGPGPPWTRISAVAEGHPGEDPCGLFSATAHAVPARIPVTRKRSYPSRTPVAMSELSIFHCATPKSSCPAASRAIARSVMLAPGVGITARAGVMASDVTFASGTTQKFSVLSEWYGDNAPGRPAHDGCRMSPPTESTKSMRPALSLVACATGSTFMATGQVALGGLRIDHGASTPLTGQSTSSLIRTWSGCAEYTATFVGGRRKFATYAGRRATSAANATGARLSTVAVIV